MNHILIHKSHSSILYCTGIFFKLYTSPSSFMNEIQTQNTHSIGEKRGLLHIKHHIVFFFWITFFFSEHFLNLYPCLEVLSLFLFTCSKKNFFFCIPQKLSAIYRLQITFGFQSETMRVQYLSLWTGEIKPWSLKGLKKSSSFNYSLIFRFLPFSKVVKVQK